MPLFRKKAEAQPQQPPQQPQVVVQVQQQPPPPQQVHVKEHTRHIPLIERPRDAESRRVLRESRLRRKLERKGLLPRDQTETEKMAGEAQDMSGILEEMRKREKKFDES